MYIKNDIAYAGEEQTIIKVKSVRALDDYKLMIRFSDDLKKIFDFTSYLQYEAYKPLISIEMFKGAYVDYGTVVWNEGEIDISPETLYLKGVIVNDTGVA